MAHGTERLWDLQGGWMTVKVKRRGSGKAHYLFIELQLFCKHGRLQLAAFGSITRSTVHLAVGAVSN